MIDMTQTFLLSGASGLIGTELTRSLEKQGAEVRRLVRREPNDGTEFEWQPAEGYLDERALKGIDVVINLSGANIGSGRWTESRKQVLYDSRVETTRLLSRALAHHDEPPSLFISQSAIGIYGDRGDEVLTETSSAGPKSDFLASLVRDWESAADEARDAGIRVVHPRTGLVIDDEAELLDRLLPLFRLGLGGPLGDGEQWWSWVDMSDVISAMRFLVDSDVEGPVNLVAPHPVRQAEFATTLAEIVNRPSVLPVPAIALKFALGSEKADAIGLTSTRAIPERLHAAGYEFGVPTLDESLRRAV